MMQSPAPATVHTSGPLQTPAAAPQPPPPLLAFTPGPPVPLHPAFLHPLYHHLQPGLASLRAAAAAAAAASCNRGYNMGSASEDKTKSFTIDAILGRQCKLVGEDSADGGRVAGHGGGSAAEQEGCGLVGVDSPAGSLQSGHLHQTDHRQHRQQHEQHHHQPGQPLAGLGKPGYSGPGGRREMGGGTGLARPPQPRLTTHHPYLGHIPCAASFSFRPHPQQAYGRDKSDKKSHLVSEWKAGKAKRVRTIFTPEQLERLEAEFERQQYMVGTERYYLAASLNLTEAQVKVWFQNRRIKWRKQNLEQQHAKLAKLDLLARHGGANEDPESDSESEDDLEHESPAAGMGPVQEVGEGEPKRLGQSWGSATSQTGLGQTGLGQAVGGQASDICLTTNSQAIHDTDKPSMMNAMCDVVETSALQASDYEDTTSEDALLPS